MHLQEPAAHLLVDLPREPHLRQRRFTLFPLKVTWSYVLPDVAPPTCCSTCSAFRTANWLNTGMLRWVAAWAHPAHLPERVALLVLVVLLLAALQPVARPARDNSSAAQILTAGNRP